MRTGLKRHRIRIEVATKTKSDSGAMVTTWSLFKPVWASIDTMRSYEKQSSDASWPGSDSMIGIDYVAGLLPTMRIVYDDKIYSILNINDVEQRHRDVVLICKQGLSAS